MGVSTGAANTPGSSKHGSMPSTDNMAGIDSIVSSENTSTAASGAQQQQARQHRKNNSSKHGSMAIEAARVYIGMSRLGS